MQISEIRCRAVLPAGGSVSLPDGLPETLLLLTHSPMLLEVNGAAHSALAGDAMLLSPRTPLRFQPAEDDLIYSFTVFEAGADASFCRALQIPENTLLRFSDTNFLTVLLEQLCSEFFGTSPRRSDMTDCLMKALLIRMSETPAAQQDPAAGSDSHYAELVRLREKIYANPQEKWTVDLMCAEVNMSRSYFQLVYRETFGMTCIADVINCKMNRARELLTATNYTIAHISQLCGYDNEEHFMRQFKKNNGVTPTVFRRGHRE